MIVDCHHHVFRCWTGTCGHPSQRLHKRYLQSMLAHTRARVYRIEDGAPADTDALFSGSGAAWEDLEEVGFRVGRFGRLEFTSDQGEDYAIQFMPVGMQQIEAPPELAVAQMTYAGVDHCILQAGGAYGVMNDDNAYAQAKFPDRISGLMWVPPATAGEPENLAEIDRAHGGLGLKGIHYDIEGFTRVGYAWLMDDARLAPFWEKLSDLGLVVCIEIHGGPQLGVAGYMTQMRAFSNLLERYPRLRWHMSLGLPAHYFARNGYWELPGVMADIYARENVFVEVTLPIFWGGKWDYPYPEAQELIRDFRDKFGVERLIWGSDMPNVERYCTYRQSLDYILRYCEFLTLREKELVLGDTATQLYGLKKRDRAGHAVDEHIHGGGA